MEAQETKLIDRLLEVTEKDWPATTTLPYRIDS
jgi:hypothetical protein